MASKLRGLNLHSVVHKPLDHVELFNMFQRGNKLNLETLKTNGIFGKIRIFLARKPIRSSIVVATINTPTDQNSVSVVLQKKSAKRNETAWCISKAQQANDASLGNKSDQ